MTIAIDICTTCRLKHHLCGCCDDGRCGSCAHCARRRPRGRPPVTDKRVPRVKMNGAEWGEVQRKAEAAGMTAAAWVRMRCGV